MVEDELKGILHLMTVGARIVRKNQGSKPMLENWIKEVLQNRLDEEQKAKMQKLANNEKKRK